MNADWTLMSDCITSSPFGMETVNSLQTTLNIKNVQHILSRYRTLVKDLLDGVNYFLDTMMMRSKRKILELDKGTGVLEKFYEEFKKSGNDLNSEIEGFEKEEARIYKNIYDSLNLYSIVKDNHNTLADTDSNISQIGHLKVMYQRQKNEIERLRHALENEKKAHSVLPRMDFVNGSSIDFQTIKNKPSGGEPRSYVEKRINMNNYIETDDIDVDATISETMVNFKSENTENTESPYKPRKSLNARTSRTRTEFQDRQRSISQRRQRSSSIFGDKGAEDNDLLSMKSDVSRHKQEITMLNREIEILRKDLMRRAKEVEVVTEALQYNLSKEKEQSSVVIKNLQKQIEDKEKELSETSRISDMPFEKQLKTVTAMKLTLDNLFKEKKELKEKLTTRENELHQIQGHVEKLKTTIKEKEKDLKELEMVNQKLTEKYLFAVQREQKAMEKLDKLTVKLKVYDKFFNDQK